MGLFDRILDKPVGQSIIKRVAQSMPQPAVSASIEKAPIDTSGRSNVSIIRTEDPDYVVSRPDNKGEYQPNDFLTLQSTYPRVGWIFRGVNDIARNVAVIPSRVVLPRINDPMRKQDVQGHPLLALLRNPNAIHTRSELLTSTASFMYLAGNAYWFIDRDENDMPTQINLVRPDRVIPIMTREGERSYAWHKVSTGKEIWPGKNVVHFSSFNPLSMIVGMPQVEPIQDSAVIDLYLMMFDAKFFTNAINPRYYVSVQSGEEEMSEAVFERTKLELRHWLQGVNNFHDFAMLENAELRQLRNEHHVDSDVRDHRELVRDEMLGQLGCYHLIALLGKANRSTLEAAYRMFWEVVLDPLLTNIQETITKELLWSYPGALGDSALDFTFDTRRIDARRESAEKRSIVNFRDWQSGLRSGAEIRYDEGYGDPLEWSEEMPPSVGAGFSRTRHDNNEMRGLTEDNFNHPETDQSQKILSEIAIELDHMDRLQSIRDAIREGFESAQQ